MEIKKNRIIIYIGSLYFFRFTSIHIKQIIGKAIS